MIRLVLLRILESYFRHRFLYLLPIVMMTVVGVLSFLTANSSYISRGVIYVRKESLLSTLTNLEGDGFGWVTPAKATVTEFEELLKTDAFRRSIILQTGLEERMAGGSIAVAETIAEAHESIWVQTLGDNLVMVGAANEDATTAQQLVAATMENFIQWKINADREESVSAESFFTDLITVYESDLEIACADLRFYLENHPEPLRGDRPTLEQMEINRLQSEIDLAGSQLENALDRQENSRLSLAQAESAARQTYLVIDTPKVATQPASSKTAALINAIVFVVVGIVLSVVAVLGGALLDRSYRFSIDVRFGLELPVLAAVPGAAESDGKGRKRKKKKGKLGETAVSPPASSPATEAA
ncbi:MAG: hypothetical protein KC419_19055 [Anaerolineales bacterium]|nr:hypothetical protein [Anaerolineales bacterium]